jgi:hypothetical protein
MEKQNIIRQSTTHLKNNTSKNGIFDCARRISKILYQNMGLIGAIGALCYAISTIEAKFFIFQNFLNPSLAFINRIIPFGGVFQIEI